jgi:hypothetical protein
MDLEFEDGDFRRYHHDMISRRDFLLAALRNDDPALAWNVRGDPEYDWLCAECLWKKECHKIKL